MKSVSAALESLSIGALLALGFSLLCGLSVLLAAAMAGNLQAVFEGQGRLQRIVRVCCRFSTSRVAGPNLARPALNWNTWPGNCAKH